MEEKLDILIKEQIRTNQLLEQLVVASGYNGRPSWDSAQEELLKELHQSGVDIPDIISTIKNTFGIERSTRAIIARLKLLGFTGPITEPIKPKKKFKTGIDEDDKPIMDRIYDDPPF